MATVFWDSKGIILIDYKPAGTSSTGEYYANVIKQLRVAIKEKQRGKLATGVLLLHDIAPVHKSRVAQAAIRECKFKQLNHPPWFKFNFFDSLLKLASIIILYLLLKLSASLLFLTYKHC